MIECNKILEVKNILRFKGEIRQFEVNNKLSEIKRFMNKYNLNETGPMINMTHGMKKKDSDIVVDIEIIIPVDREFTSTEEFEFSPIFKLVNAVKMRCEGNPALLQKKYDELNKYIIDNKMTPITGGYNVLIKGADTTSQLDNMILEVYVGIKSDKSSEENILN